VSGVILYGDPHGEWRPLLRECREDAPDGVVVVGDCDLAVPLKQQLAPLFEAGIKVRWIPGNHDTDCVEWHDRLFGDCPEGNLHGRWCGLGGMIFAGLGGVYKERIWYPRVEGEVATFESRAAYLRSLPRSDRWRGGLPLHMRDGIFPEDVDALSKLRADVLITHEAPSTHRHGFVGVDDAARACRAKLIVHGHHHESVHGFLPGDVEVRGLAKGEVLRLSREDLV
jgi:Icc-related predicted phosphoesterase